MRTRHQQVRILRAALPVIRRLDHREAEAGVRKVLSISSLAGCFGAAGQANDACAGVEGRLIKVGVDPGLIDAMDETVPLGRGGTPGEAAGAAVVSCIPDSNDISGQTPVCSGGLTGLRRAAASRRLARKTAMAATDLVHRLPRRLKMSEPRVCTAVLEQRSLRKAAALRLTQPAVTKAIAGLDDTLGVKPFDRVAGGVEPTVHGRSFVLRARAVLDERRRAAQELALLSGGAVGSLCEGVPPLPAIPFVPVAVNRLLDQHPGVRVSLFEEGETGLLDRLCRRVIELAILRLAPLDPQDDLRVERLFVERLCVLAAPPHPLAARAALQWPERLAQRWVLPPADGFFHEHVQRSLDRLHMPMPRHAVEAASIQLQFGLVPHAGMLGFGMRSQIGFAPGRAFVVRLPFELPVAGAVVAAVSLKSHEPSPLARQPVGHVQALVKTPPAPVTPARHEALAIEAAP